MNWKSIARQVGAVAPALGAALGGPAGGAAGALVASALGVSDEPEQVAAALKSDPEAAARLQRLEREHERELTALVLEAETAQQGQINATMRAELSHEGWYKSGWRPFIGYVAGVSFAGLMFALVVAMLERPQDAGEIIASATVVLSIFLGVLGFNVRQRSVDKQAKMGYSPSSLIATVSQRLTGGK